MERKSNISIESNKFISDVYQAICKDYNKKKAEKIKRQMINYRIAAGMRERPKFDIVRIFSLGRIAIKSIGQSYVKSGYIDKAEDIFFIRLDDIYDTANLRKMIKENKEMYNAEMKRTSIPRVILNNGEVIYSSNKIDLNDNVIKGMSLSPGSYEGIIRIVNNPGDNELKEGEIMVTESTNPAWTPLFATAGALIMEYGGPMSHGGVIAREYGLPAVVGISAVTSILKDGDKVRVNGELGIVELLK